MTASGIGSVPASGGPRAMTLWRLERLRLIRTYRWLALFGVYVVFGLLGPVMAAYLPDILSRVQSDMTIIVPPPQPRDGLVNYVDQVTQTGVIVVVAVAVGALAFDAHPGISTFLRTRSTSVWSLLRPRIGVILAAAVLAYALGTFAAWYATAVLLGPLPAGPVFAGLLCAATYLGFVITVVTAATAITRSTLGAVGIALSALLLVSIIGSLGPLHDWLPSTLAGAPAELLATGTSLTDYLPALAVAIASGSLVLVFAVRQLDKREV